MTTPNSQNIVENIQEIRQTTGVLMAQCESIFNMIKEVKTDISTLEVATVRIAIHESILERSRTDVDRLAKEVEKLKTDYNLRMGRMSLANMVGSFIVGCAVTASVIMRFMS